MTTPSRRPSVSPAVFYRDPWAALDWLERTFGFARSVVVSTPDGKLAHAELTYAGGTLMVGGEWAEFVTSPLGVGGRNTQCVHVQLADGIDAHCERARQAGAVILQEPADQFWGDRTYRARDPEQHVWTFGQQVRAVSAEEAAAATGLKIGGWS
ncbi:glyoxalase [Burkholderia ubonensis]|uniref:VOC family protein n=1 Tax=Burkholderia ubonensis TaxID=101571 RepID=UPI000756CD75|nr:VOC family protein [Burkholderia ubonensis]KVO40529.1 glyoxalase [Burkholderia ubonensis]KVP26839.1 glyoxalase [Burkholderia ubonensis]KWD11434.1 glyoxalase [Burkholderia ubonensis]KWD20649.1 glyoxalase [Burkholderia ubonensis]KWO94116.1 glyoxalase [Burkholderia ubonensis]